MLSNAQKRELLTAHYEDGFESLYEKALSEHKTPNAALNSLDVVESLETVRGLYLSMNLRKNKEQDITAITFILIGDDGANTWVKTPTKRYGGSEVVAMIREKWPDVSRLSPVSITQVRSRFSILDDFTNLYLTDKSKLTEVSTSSVDIPVMFGFEDAVRQTQEELSSGRSDFETSRYLFLVEGRSVIPREDEDGNIETLTLNLRDLDGRMMGTKVQENLTDMFSKEQVDEYLEDIDDLNLQLHREPLVVYGRLFLKEAGDVLTLDSGEVELERAIRSIIVKNTGFVVKFDQIAESVRDTIAEKLRAIGGPDLT